MNDQLRDLLQEAARIDVPSFDTDGVIARGDQRLRRRRAGAALGVAVAVAAIAAGTALAARTDSSPQEGGPISPPSSRTTGAVEIQRGARPLVYAADRTVHVGNRTIEAKETVAFIEATDDGAVYEASLDGTLWFTDGVRNSVIGTSGCTACPTPHPRVVTTSDSGSLVVWADVAGRPDQDAVEFVVYDTSRRAEVARIPFPMERQEYSLIHVGDHEVWFNQDDGMRSDLFRFDVSTAATTKITMNQLRADLRGRDRVFSVEDPDSEAFVVGASFRQVGKRLVPVTSAGDPQTLTLANGAELRLRLPEGYRTPAVDSPTAISQWLDDHTVVVWTTAGGGDGPRQHGDLLVCGLPDGVCRVEVPRSSIRYVAPARG